MGAILFHVLACCLLAMSLVKAQTVETNSTITPATHADLTTESTTDVTSDVNEETTTSATVTWANKTFNDTTVQPQTSKSTAMLTPPTNSTSLSTATSYINTTTFTVPMTAASQTTIVDISTPGTTVTTTPDTTVITTANTSHTANTTSTSDDRITHGVGFNTSEKNITIVFSVVLGTFAVAFVIFMFHRCKQKSQYSHQPFTNTDDPDAFVAGEDTLVISGGLYDGHPIYDNVPTAQDDQSQFRLQFLH